MDNGRPLTHPSTSHQAERESTLQIGNYESSENEEENESNSDSQLEEKSFIPRMKDKECKEHIVLKYGNRKLLQKVNCHIERLYRKFCFLKVYGLPKEILYRTNNGEMHKYVYAGKVTK
ncbi:hypothetical protein TNIN_8651 [Trichonephila inaurata madagascariensis]|uniref:Uncharacterized protein n=1 Tax=Trichonephila inaurata madagascariensis TaxID=2747483 RepID=A0A8X6WXP3_9ARAC|nr:hypothetical protein TNIN_8651 [Trichonephila inaurata madagascariensis]